MLSFAVLFVTAAPATSLSHADAVSDIKELARLLEETHPDPYTRFGGKVAFARRAQEIVARVPQNGASAEWLSSELRPFVAGLGDGHTKLDRAVTDSPRKLSIEFSVVDGKLYVAKVFREEDRASLGALLVAVNDVSTQRLLGRTAQLRGADNAYTNLRNLARFVSSEAALRELLEEKTPAGTITLSLRLPDGKTAATRAVFVDKQATSIEPPSSIRVPSLDAADIGWGFLGVDRRIAYVRIASMARYREAFELWRSTGMTRLLGDHLTEVSTAAGAKAGASTDERIAAIPSATETFRALFTAMKTAKTSALIVDLRGNDGGNSLMSDIFGHFIFPLDRWLSADGGYEVRRISELYFKNKTEESLAKVRERLGNDFALGDYDFSDEAAWRERKLHGLSAPELAKRRKEHLENMRLSPTFFAALSAGDFAGTASPKLIVLTDAKTYSAGYDLAVVLFKMGATLVGVPSAQAGNCFIDSLSFRLSKSGLTGTISDKWSVVFPDQPDLGDVLHPRHELRYEDLVSMRFDPNAALIRALALIEQKP